MSQILENYQRAPGNIAMKTLGVFWRNEAIPVTPDDESGELQFGNAMRQATAVPLMRAIQESAAIALALSQFDRTVHHLSSHPIRIAPNVAKTLLDKVARQNILEEPESIRECSRDENRSAARLASLGSLLRRPE